VIAMGEYIDTLGEIYLERERYLLNTDQLLEEMLCKTKIEIIDNIKVEFGCIKGQYVSVRWLIQMKCMG